MTVKNYGSGIYPGPSGTAPIQDSNWTLQTLEWGWIGDSITYRCASRLRAAFGASPATSFAVRAHSGQNWQGSMDWLDSVTYMPDKLVVALGSNDVQNPFGVAAQIDRLKTIIGPGVELFLVDTYVNRPGYPNHDLRNSGQVNQALRGAVDDAHYIEWVGALTATVGRGVALDNYIQDGVHPWDGAGTGHADGCDFFVANAMQQLQAFM